MDGFCRAYYYNVYFIPQKSLRTGNVRKVKISEITGFKKYFGKVRTNMIATLVNISHFKKTFSKMLDNKIFENQSFEIFPPYTLYGSSCHCLINNAKISTALLHLIK